MSTSTVTIDKEYFLTLLRRAEFHVSGQDLTTPPQLEFVSIPKHDHVNLLRDSQDFAALKEALYRGGIAAETLDILIRGNTGTPQPDGIPDASSLLECGSDFLSNSQRPPALTRQSGNIYNGHSGPHAAWPSKEQGSPLSKTKSGLYGRQYSFGRDDTSYPSEVDKDDQGRGSSGAGRHQYARVEQRTVVAQNLSDRTTHKDLLQVIRGGTILDIFLRPHERSASISFLEGSAAQDFMNYVKRSDIYIHGKRVEWAWNDRQFILPGHVAYKILGGATRNLVIRSVHPNITEQRIREDLDHIHNLIIIDVSYQKGDAHISLNSIHNAIFARTCMQSRLTYKNSKIEWSPDECSLPLPKPPQQPKKENNIQPVQRPNNGGNRFHMLNTDGTEDGSNTESEEAEDQAISGMASMQINHRSPWNPTTVVA